MKIRNITFPILLFLTGFCQAQNIFINAGQQSGVTYCRQSLYIAPNFTMTSSATISGMKISFSSGFTPGEDELRLVGYSGTLTRTWYGSKGYLTLSYGTSIDDYIQAIRKIQYINNATVPTIGDRIITFSLIDADYLPETGHFYRFVSMPGITWTAARAAAESPAMKYHGLQGYLANISSEGENEFIKTKTSGLGWIGASDQAVEGEWRWVTGPEGTEDGGKGRLFFRGSGGQAKADPVNFGPVKDTNGVPAYHNWNRWNTPPNGNVMHYEPNDNASLSIDHQEDYVHITDMPQTPDQNKKWNDFPNDGGSAGYLIEFGGSQGDPSVSLVDNMTLSVKTVSFNTNWLPVKCQGDTVHLNKPEKYASYVWTPTAGLSNPTISNPVANPAVSTDYKVIGINGRCRDSTVFKLQVKPAPVSLLKDGVMDICTGDKITLDPGAHPSYLWGSGETTRTITRSVSGLNKVKLTASNGCYTKDSVYVVVHDYPKMDLSKMNPLTCGSLTTTVNISSDKGTYILTNLSNNQQFNGTTISVAAYGNYPFSALVTDPYGCNSDTSLTLRFHNIPVVNLTIDETVCYGYNLQASYIGDANPPVSRFTWIFGGDTISNMLGQSTEQIPLGVNQTKRDLVLKVTEDGCTGGNSLKDIHVIPDLKLSVKDPLQCQPETFEFAATNTETVVKYEWEWGDGSTGTGKNATHKYTKEGYYDVNLVVTTDKGCMNSATIKNMVYVAPIPTVGFSITPDMCLNPGKDTLYYSGSANNMDTYYWDLKGFDPVEIIQSPDTTAGPFVFELINKPKTKFSLYVISQYNCKSATASLEVKRKPIFSFTHSLREGCAPLPLNFKGKPEDPVDQLSFNWDFGDGNGAAGAEVDHIYEIPDRKQDVTLSALSSITGCSDTVFNSGYITVYPNPKAGFTMDHDIVYNDAPKVSFSDQSVDAVNYYWDFGDRLHSREKDPVHSYAVVGKRKVVQTVYNQFDCQDTTSKVVLVAFSRIFAPNAFSPNASNEIDRIFHLSSEGIKKEGYHLTIFSRWNDIVFECRDEVKAWDGKMSNGNYAPVGNYIWMLECIDFLDRPHRQSGSLMLVF